MVPNGFRGVYHAFNIYVFNLYDRVRKMPIEEVDRTTSGISAADGSGRFEQSGRDDAGSSESRNVAQRAFNNRSRERRRDGKRDDRPARTSGDSPRGKKGNLAARLSPDDPRLPKQAPLSRRMETRISLKRASMLYKTTFPPKALR